MTYGGLLRENYCVPTIHLRLPYIVLLFAVSYNLSQHLISRHRVTRYQPLTDTSHPVSSRRETEI